MEYFDFDRVAVSAGIREDQLQQLCRLIREEFPADDMLYELHVLRACKAVRDGYLTIEEALRPESPAKEPSAISA